jgi:hypothetical protein
MKSWNKSCQILDTHVAVHDGVIAGLGHYSGHRVLDVKGLSACGSLYLDKGVGV